MTRQELETALDAGRLEVCVSHGKWYKARRNGSTKLWKTRPDDFNIPCKVAFNSFLSVDRLAMVEGKVRIV